MNRDLGVWTYEDCALVLGTISMLIGLALLVTAVRLSTPSLALFLLSGALISIPVIGARALLGRSLNNAKRAA